MGQYASQPAAAKFIRNNAVIRVGAIGPSPPVRYGLISTRRNARRAAEYVVGLIFRK
jgi:hypothetical protein